MLKYSSDCYEENFEKLHREIDIFLENKHDKPSYAYLNWRTSYGGKGYKFKEIAEGYFVSSILLLSESIKNHTERLGDATIFPIIFNVLHGIELYLKGMLFIISDYCDNKGYSFTANVWGHSIKDLLSEVKNQAMSLGLDSITCKDISILEDFFNQMFKYSDDVTFARYPYDARNAEHFYINMGTNIILDMQVLAEWVKSIFYVLDRNFINLSGEIKSGNQS